MFGCAGVGDVTVPELLVELPDETERVFPWGEEDTGLEFVSDVLFAVFLFADLKPE